MPFMVARNAGRVSFQEKVKNVLFSCNVHVYVYDINMKKRELTKRMVELGWWMYKEGAKHEKWTNGEIQTVIPRTEKSMNKLPSRS